MLLFATLCVLTLACYSLREIVTSYPPHNDTHAFVIARLFLAVEICLLGSFLILFFFPLMKKETKKSRLILVFLNSTFYCIIVSRLFIWFPNRVEDKLWTLAIP